MPPQRPSPELDAMRVPLPPSTSTDQTGEDLARLGETLKTRTEDVLTETVSKTGGPDHAVDALVQGSFERICKSSTIAGARWMSGEGMEVAIQAGQETWEIFAELAAARAASLNERSWA